MRYAVFGPKTVRGEEYDNESYVHGKLATVDDMTALVLGGGKGCEEFAKTYGERNKIIIEFVRPRIALLGNEDAFRERDRDMIAKADKIIIFWDGQQKSACRISSSAILEKKAVLLFPL